MIQLGTAISRTLSVARIGPIASRCIEAITGLPCDCEKREEQLNAIGKRIYESIVPRPATMAKRPCKGCK